MVANFAVERVGGSSTIRIDRPAKKNALTPDMFVELGELLNSESASGATAVVLTGGPEIFSAGADFGAIGHGDKDIEIDGLIADLVTTITGLQIPVIAAVEGACVGAAVEVALSCDVRVVSRTSYFSMPVTKLGILYRPDGIANILSNVGLETATRLLVLGERISGEEAGQARIASQVVEPSSTLDRALSLAKLAEENVPAAVSATKRLLRELNTSKVDVTEFEFVRRELLRSEARIQAVADLQERLGR